MHIDVSSAKIEEARSVARAIVANVARTLHGRSTTGIERAVARLCGVDGADGDGVPWANRLVDHLASIGRLHDGVARVLAEVEAATSLAPPQAVLGLVGGTVDAAATRRAASETRIAAIVGAKARHARSSLAASRMRRDQLVALHGEPSSPWLYVIVATGDIHEDVEQACLAARHGAHVIAVIRSTAQSLLDHVPEGLTREGYGGTYATRANFRLMRSALDDVSAELGRYVRLVNYASGLCMPEMAVLGAFERLDMMLSDSMYGILFRDIHVERTLIDQHFARTIQGLAGIVINTGEDNYLTTDDAFTAAHTVLASQFINEAFASRASMPAGLVGLGHAFEMDPEIENGLLYEIADALLSRHCFPSSPLKYMPPTRHVTGDLFFAHVMNALFNLTSVATGQSIHLVGVLSEGAHTPYIHERHLALENAKYVHRYARDFAAAFDVKTDGIVARRAAEVLDRAVALLRDVDARTLFGALESGAFAGIRRSREGGRGRDGVFTVSARYVDLLPMLAEDDLS